VCVCELNEAPHCIFFWDCLSASRVKFLFSRQRSAGHFHRTHYTELAQLHASQSHAPQSHAPQSHAPRSKRLINHTASENLRSRARTTNVTELHATHTFLHATHTLALAWYMRDTKNDRSNTMALRPHAQGFDEKQKKVIEAVREGSAFELVCGIVTKGADAKSTLPPNTHPLTHSFAHSHVPTHLPIHSLTHPLTHQSTHPLIYLLTHTLTHQSTHLLAHSLTHSPTHPPTHTAEVGELPPDSLMLEEQHFAPPPTAGETLAAAVVAAFPGGIEALRTPPKTPGAPHVVVVVQSAARAVETLRALGELRVGRMAKLFGKHKLAAEQVSASIPCIQSHRCCSDSVAYRPAQLSLLQLLSAFQLLRK
jgi:hypothetical protein